MFGSLQISHIVATLIATKTLATLHHQNILNNALKAEIRVNISSFDGIHFFVITLERCFDLHIFLCIYKLCVFLRVCRVHVF